MVERGLGPAALRAGRCECRSHLAGRARACGRSRERSGARTGGAVAAREPQRRLLLVEHQADRDRPLRPARLPARPQRATGPVLGGRVRERRPRLDANVHGGRSGRAGPCRRHGAGGGGREPRPLGEAGRRHVVLVGRGAVLPDGSANRGHRFAHARDQPPLLPARPRPAPPGPATCCSSASRSRARPNGAT